MILALDECFLDFLAEPEACSLAGQVERCPNLVVFRAFTKFWGMAGLRLGYVLCGNAQLLSRMYQSGQPWPVSAPAQAAAMERLLPLLTDEEADVYRRGRNTAPHSVPRAATRAQYQSATGLEALFGWLYLQGRTDRLNELFEAIMDIPA